MSDLNPYEAGSGPGQPPPQPKVDPKELESFAQLLEAKGIGFHARSQLMPIEGLPGGVVWIMNRAALLRCAAGLLKLASKDPEVDSGSDLSQHPSWEQPVEQTNHLWVAEIRHTLVDSLWHPAPAQPRVRRWLIDRIWLFGCAVVGFFIIALFLSGCLFWYLLLSGRIE